MWYLSSPVMEHFTRQRKPLSWPPASTCFNSVREKLAFSKYFLFPFASCPMIPMVLSLNTNSGWLICVEKNLQFFKKYSAPRDNSHFSDRMLIVSLWAVNWRFWTQDVGDGKDTFFPIQVSLRGNNARKILKLIAS